MKFKFSLTDPSTLAGLAAVCIALAHFLPDLSEIFNGLAVALGGGAAGTVAADSSK